MKRIAATLMVLVMIPVLALAAVISGTVVRVDNDKNEMVIKTEKGQETVVFTRSTKGADKATEGTRVTINYQQNGGKLVASEIAVSSAGPKIPPFTGGDVDSRPSPSDRPSQPSLPPAQLR
jgi:hypothetical protein